MYDYADSIDKQDGCITKEEFKAAEELEGPPPGFEKKKATEMNPEDPAAAEAALAEQQAEQDRYMFDAMDSSGDGKVSKQEAYTYAGENMDAADIDQQQLDAMFDSTDVNGDGVLTFDEFTGAGAQVKGDGDEMSKAEPMKFKIMKVRRVSTRTRVAKKLLARKPSLKVMAHLWNIAASARVR